MQVYAVLSHHVMFVARISEEIRLGTRVDAGTQERQGVLRDAHRVVVTDDDLEFAFQVTGFESQVTAFVAFGNDFRNLTPSIWSFISSTPRCRKVTFSKASPRCSEPRLSRMNSR